MKCGRFPVFKVQNRMLESETIYLKEIENIDFSTVLKEFTVDENRSPLNLVGYTNITVKIQIMFLVVNHLKINS